MKYPILVAPDGTGYLITCPSLPEVTTDAERLEEVFARAEDAVEEALAARRAAGEPIPVAAIDEDGEVGELDEAFFNKAKRGRPPHQ
jgi:antitoxin HicB